MKKNIYYLLTVTILFCFWGCDKTDDIIESFDSTYGTNTISDYFVETFEYDQYGTYGELLRKKGTGYRIMKTNNETGEKQCACIDPLCTHNIDANCPVTSENKISLVGRSNQYLLFLYPNSVVSTECMQYDLETGEIYSIFKAENGTVTLEMGGNCLFYIIPDIVDGTSVYSLVKYEIDTREYKTLKSHDSIMIINAVSNKRVYFGSVYLPGISTQTAEYWSTDYSGDEFKEENGICFTVNMAIGSIAFGSSGGTNIGYNVETGEETVYEPENGTSALGYWKKEDKIVYATCERMKEGRTMNPDTYCLKYGISMDEFYASSEHYEKLEEERAEIFFGSGIKIVSCDLDGSNASILFELEKNIFIDSGIIQAGRSGCISEDNMYVVATVMVGEKTTTKNCKIDLNTGAIEEIE